MEQKLTKRAKPVLIVGFGITGKSVERYFTELGTTVVIIDDKVDRSDVISSSVQYMTQKELIDTFRPDQFLHIVLSPGISPSHPVVRWSEQFLDNSTSEIELAANALVELATKFEKKIKIIGVTGTNGKTTTVELITHLLKYAGRNAVAYGNIGVPLLDLVVEILQSDTPALKIPEIVVLELSSFQLARISSSFLTSCALLNIAPDHLDWHGTLDEYAKAKKKIVTLLDPSSTAFALIHESVEKITAPSYVEIMQYGEGLQNNKTAQKLPESLQTPKSAVHDIDNFRAASEIVLRCAVPYMTILEGYKSFEKADHRIQHVTTISVSDSSVIDVYDDSKGTNIHATVAAIKAVLKPIVLIAGGVHKGYPYSEWRELFPGRVSCVITLGEASKIIHKDLLGVVDLFYATSMEDAVQQAIAYSIDLCQVSPRVSLLLSPGCSSYDMFKSYKDRGEQFQQAIASYIKKNM